VAELVFRGADVVAHEVSPWLDLAFIPFKDISERLESQTHRRLIKTHLPLDALVFSPKARYI
jgi:aryl sulfotransferase